MAELTVVEATDRFTHVAIRGTLDAAGVGVVDLELASQTVPRRKPAIIDLREVGLITSLGIGMLVAMVRSLRAHGLASAVVATHTVAGVLRMTSIDELVPVVDTPEEALHLLQV